MRTLCYQSLRSNRLLVSEYEEHRILVSQECKVFFETPCMKCNDDISVHIADASAVRVPVDKQQGRRIQIKQ